MTINVRRKLLKLTPLQVVAYLLLTFWAVICLMPLYWIFVTAFQPPSVVLAMPPKLYPSPATLVNFVRLKLLSPIFVWLRNSAMVTISVTSSNVLLGTMAGYVLAKKKFPGQGYIFAIIVAMMMIPGQLTIVPLFILVNRFRWIDSFAGLIIPWLVEPFAIFLMKQYLQTIPSELIDAGRIDGCGEVSLFTRIIMPVAKPGMAVLAIFIFTGNWNDFFWPLLATTKAEMRTLQVGLSTLRFQFYSDYGLLMAGAAVAALPLIVVFLSLQRYFIRGITVGSLKG